jgi:hypothetical protein
MVYLPSRNAAPQRNDAHNVSTDAILAMLGRCGMTHLASGRVCARPARHEGPCEFSVRDEAYASLVREPGGACKDPVLGRR